MEQQQLLSLVQEAYNLILEGNHGHSKDGLDLRALHDQMAETANKLHLSLKSSGCEPQYGKHMLTNRGVPPTEIEFYRHVHAVEDLFNFLNDSDANKDPVDVTIGAEFKVRIYSRRWGRDDTYTIKRTPNGWDISQMVRGGPSDKKGNPGFYKALDGDSINYPEELPGYMEWLWERAAEDGLTKDDVASALDDLAAWISTCEKASPRGIFQGFK
jgi:hypothetical protein